MAWNEPGGGNNRPNDPWGNNGGNRNGGNQGPPDLDEILSKFFERINKLFGGSGSGGSGSGQGPDKAVLGLVAIVAAIVYIVWSFTIIQEGERGVIQTFGEHTNTVGPGPIFTWKPFQTIRRVNVDNVNSIDSGRYTKNQREMLTKDENIVIVRYSVQYKINNAENFLFNLADPVETLYQVAESSVREVIGQNDMDQITTQQREKVVVKARQRTQDIMDSYQAGIEITNFNFSDAKYPEAVQSAIDDVTRAREDHERYINEAQAYSNQIIPEARGERVQMVERAKAYKARVVESAEGEAERFLSLYNEYRKAPQVTRDRLYIDAVESVMSSTHKVMVDTEGGNNMLYLPLDKILEKQRHSQATGSAANSNSATNNSSSSNGGGNKYRSRTREVR